MKRGTDHMWQLIKYKDDICIYARCKCGYDYPCSRSGRNSDETFSFKQIPVIFYNYCPNCGARKKYKSSEIISGGYMIDLHHNDDSKGCDKT